MRYQQQRKKYDARYAEIAAAHDAITGWIDLHLNEAERLRAMVTVARTDRAQYDRRIQITLSNTEPSTWRDAVVVLHRLITLHHAALEQYWSEE